MRVSRLMAGIVLAAQAGCTTVHVIPGEELSTGSSARVSVTKADGSLVTIFSPRVLDDTIFGFNQAGTQFALPLNDAKVIRRREVSVGRTAALGAVGFAGMLVVAKILIGRGDAPPDQEITDDAVVPLLKLLHLLHR